MRIKLLAASGLTALVVASAGPALAHVTTDPDSAPKGGEITLRFRVPNEETGASTTQVELDIPTDHPLLGVNVEPLAGWKINVTTRNLNPPVQTDDGPVSEAVSQIVWSAGSIGPGQFQEFPILVQQLPKDANQVAFKAVQSYNNGDVVRWIDPVVAGQPAPEHPTPILTLTATPLDPSQLAAKRDVNDATTDGVIGIIEGSAAILLSGAALLILFRRRPGRQSDA
jgi:uncharacterized protein YcnI